MEVKRITDAEILTSILKIDDPGLHKNVLDPLKCSEAEWNQGLIMMVEADIMRVYGVIEGDHIKGYVIAVNCFAPPFSRHVGIGYLYLEDNLINAYGDEILSQVKSWADEIGVKQLRLACESEGLARLYARFGFKKANTIIMTLDW